MNDDELTARFEKALTELAEKHNIYHEAERKSYFRYGIKNGAISYRLPDMQHNQFIIDAIELAETFFES